MTYNSYTSSQDFIKDLEFSYIETYSLQRGIQYEERYHLGLKELKHLRNKNTSSDSLSGLESIKLKKLEQDYGVTQYLINSDGKLHHSAQKIGSFPKNSSQVTNLLTILNTPAIDVPYYMCAPIYRDAIIFYDENNNRIATLNVCLSCEYMETKRFNHIDADMETYKLMKDFFKLVGHQIELQ